MFKELIIPAGLLSAMIIGAGMFSLPYLFNLSGIVLGFFYLITFGIYFSIIHLMYAEIIGHSEKHYRGDHRFVGLAKIYLGTYGFGASILTTVLGLILTLLIYIALSVSFISVLLPFIGKTFSAILFWAVSTLPVLVGLKKIADLGLVIIFLMIIVMVGVFLYGVPAFGLDRLVDVNVANALLPYSAVLFSLAGRSAISSIRNYLKEKHVSLKQFDLSIFLGTMTPAVFYGFFVIGVIGLSDGNVSEDAISGLTGLPVRVLIAFATLGIMSIWTSYIFLGFELKGILVRDFRTKETLGGAIIALIPISLYFLGIDDFLTLIGIAGGILLAVESMLVVLMWLRVVKRNLFLKIFSVFLMTIFLLGAFYEANKLF